MAITVQIRSHQRRPVSQPEVTLEGLPKGVMLRKPYPRITSASEVVVFELESSNEVLLGLVRGIRGVVTITAAGQTVTQRSGDGTLRIDPAR